MAQYNHYVSVPHSSYEVWRTNTIGNGYNLDYNATVPPGGYGNQCWDYVANLYWQYGRTLYTRPGGGYAKDCWIVSRQANSVSPFISIDGKTNIKRGDIIVTNGTSKYPTGHICFADEDYNGTNTIRTLGQMPATHGINGVVSLDDLSLNLFLGIFRNTDWKDEPGPGPTPPPGENEIKTKKGGFPWVTAWNYWGYRH